MPVQSLAQFVMDSPETDLERNGVGEGEFNASHRPLLTVGMDLPTDGISVKRGIYEINGRTISEDEGRAIILYKN